MKGLSEIPTHKFSGADLYACYTEGLQLGEPGKSHRIDFFALIWFLENAGLHYIDFEPYPIYKNTIYLLARNQVHALPGIQPNARIILLSKNFFDSIEHDDLRFLFAHFQNSGIKVPADKVQPLTHLFELILLENEGQQETRLLQAYLSAFLFQLQRISSHFARSAAYQDVRMRKLFELIGSHYKSQKLSSFYADQIGVSPRRLNQIVKSKLNLSVSQLIYNYILIEAKREISHSTKSLKEIAIDLGFNGQSYFSRFFKKQTGRSPEQFRQRNA